MTLKERFKNWLIGYKVSGMTIEVSLVGYDKLINQLGEIEKRLEHIAELQEKVKL